MSYDHPRIRIEDTMMQIVLKMGEGNPGATNVLCMLLKEGGKIDPDDAFGGFGSLMGLDNLDLYASRIWLLYKDVCGQDLVKMVGVLRAVQLGIVREAEVLMAVMACANRSPDDQLDIDGLLAKVKARLPRFAVMDIPAREAPTGERDAEPEGTGGGAAMLPETGMCGPITRAGGDE